MRSGAKVPDRILHQPLLPLYLQFFVDAFWELNSCRAMGMGEGPIPFTAILQYSQFYECDFQLAQDLILFIREMDDIYLKKQAKKAKAKAAKTKAKK